MLGSFFFGLFLPARALRLILSRRQLLLWSLLPLTVSIGLYVFLLAQLQGAAKGLLLGAWTSWGWDPSGVGATVALVLVQILVWIAGVLSFSVGGSIIASPFNDFLAEAAERHAEPPLPAVPNPSLGTRVRQVLIDGAKSLAALAAGLCALLLSWIPVVNVLALVLTWLLISFQYLSYPQTRRNQDLRTGLRFLRQNFAASLGLGMTLSVFFALPLVSVFCLPVAVVSGTLLFARAEGRNRLQAGGAP